MTGTDQHLRPVVYGDPHHVTVSVEWLMRLVGRQPLEVLKDPSVHVVLQRLGDAVAGWCDTDGDAAAERRAP